MSTEFAFKKKTEQTNTPQEIIATEYDVVKFVGTVHSQIKKENLITEDFKLAKFNEQEQEYILEQTKDAHIIRTIIKQAYGEKQAQEIYNILTIQPQLLAILKVNTEKNFLVKAILKTTQQTETETETETKTNNTTNKNKNNKKETNNEEEEMI